MLAMAVLCRTRIRFSRLLVHLVGSGDLVGGIEEREKSSGRYSFRVVDPFVSTYVAGLMSGDSYWFKGSIATTLA